MIRSAQSTGAATRVASRAASKILGWVVVAFICANPGWSQTASSGVCDSATVALRSTQGQLHRFSVELADDPSERAKGLMGRAEMASASGMLFAYSAPGNPVFWMKDTLIPLDMLFFDASGRLVRLHAMANPHDLSTIDGGPGVQFVLEINGGLAAALGLTIGAEMRHPAIAQENAAFPCE
jgi:uncharacterized membrane protein (UPF0127 family)